MWDGRERARRPVGYVVICTVWRCWYRWLLVSCEIFTTISCNVAIWLTNLSFLIRGQTMLIVFKCQAMVIIYLSWTHLAAPHESKTFWALWWQISLLLQTTLNKCKDQYTCNVQFLYNYGYTVYVWYILKFTCFFCLFVFFFRRGGGTDLEFFKPTTTVYNNLVFQCMST